MQEITSIVDIRTIASDLFIFLNIRSIECDISRDIYLANKIKLQYSFKNSNAVQPRRAS